MTSVAFRTPSVSRLRALMRCPTAWSLLRRLEYEEMARLKLSGRVLDFGGGSRTNYADQVGTWADPSASFEYVSANIDPKTEPTYLLTGNPHIPVDPEVFDAVISLNTFEHIYDLKQSLIEINRVTKVGGELIFIVPFLFKVHGHPDDFHRGTPSFWARLLSEVGFGNLRVKALGWGPFSTAQTISGTPGPMKAIRRTLSLLIDLIYFSIKYGADTVVSGQQDSGVFSNPIGYMISASKFR